MDADDANYYKMVLLLITIFVTGFARFFSDLYCIKMNLCEEERVLVSLFVCEKKDLPVCV
jgi:hypothetical protein